jgi:hypothetical protein
VGGASAKVATSEEEMSSSLANIVATTSRAKGSFSRIETMASSPSMTGIRKSIQSDGLGLSQKFLNRFTPVAKPWQ